MKNNKSPVPVLRPHVEDVYAEELTALSEVDQQLCPANWLRSPQAVVTYLLGGTLKNGQKIEPKYFGSRRLIEIAVATLATDRALLLVGVPGTAKTWVAEHLAAAICGDSKLLVQGTAGLHDDALRYGWNYARLIAEGPSEKALVASPVMAAMQDGKIARIEELTRIPSDVQDNLITLLSEKNLPIPELNQEIQARPGFNLIATANNRDKGVNDLSSALQRRFNTVLMPLPASLEEEVKIVKHRVEKIGTTFGLTFEKQSIKEIRRLVTIFRELRSGVTEEGDARVKTPSATLSTAEAISVINSGKALATHFGNGEMKAADLAASLTGAVVKDASQDRIIWKEYLESIMKDRDGWQDLYEACSELL